VPTPPQTIGRRVPGTHWEAMTTSLRHDGAAGARSLVLPLRLVCRARHRRASDIGQKSVRSAGRQERVSWRVSRLFNGELSFQRADGGQTEQIGQAVEVEPWIVQAGGDGPVLDQLRERASVGFVDRG